MDDTTILGSVVGQIGQTVKKAGQQVVHVPEEMAKDLGGQIGGGKPAASPDSSGEPKQKQWQSDEERIKFLKDLYGTVQSPTEASASSNTADKPAEKVKQKTANQTSANPLVKSEEKPTEFQEQIKDKSPEDQKKLLELRQQLHKDVYYDPTFNPVKKQEERPAEKVENEKKQEMAELQQKEEKKLPPPAVIRERNKAEMFRGAAG